jgi:hypothetical protein
LARYIPKVLGLYKPEVFGIIAPENSLWLIETFSTKPFISVQFSNFNLCGKAAIPKTIPGAKAANLNEFSRSLIIRISVLSNHSNLS